MNPNGCSICGDEKVIYAKCPGCDCIFCEEDYNDLNTPYIAEPALVNRIDNISDEAWAQMQRDEIEYNKNLNQKLEGNIYWINIKAL